MFSSVIQLQQPLVKVPFEQLRKAGRNEQKYCDKELNNAIMVIKQVVNQQRSGQMTADKATATLASLTGRLKQLQRKVNELDIQQNDAYNQSKARVQHLERLAAVDSMASMDWKTWNQDNLNVLLTEYMLRMGQLETARQLAEETHVQDIVDFGLYTKAKKIADALEGGSCKVCLVWCADNRAILLKQKSLLEFELYVQEFIDLVRKGEHKAAIQYARQHLAPCVTQTGDLSGQDALDMMATKRQQLERVMALVACQPHALHARYSAYFSPKRWTYLKDLFLTNFCEISGLFPQPILIAALRAGLSALKTPSCHAQDDQPTRNMHCPVCVKPLCELARDVPRAHHVHSTILCSISGLVIGGDELAGVGPNGSVYAYKVFEEGAKRNGGVFVDPRTGESFTMSQVRKLYIT